MSERSERRKKIAAAQALLKAKGKNPHVNDTIDARKPVGKKPGKNGRPLKDVKDYFLQEEARARTPEALEAIVEIMRNSADEATVLAAARLIIERAHGKPKQEMDLQVSKPETIVLTPMTEQEATAAYMRMIESSRDEIDIDFSQVKRREPRPAALDAPDTSANAQRPVSTPQGVHLKPTAPAIARPMGPPKPVVRAKPPVDPRDGSIIAVITTAEQDAELRNVHVHKPMADSRCSQCRQLWVNS